MQIPEEYKVIVEGEVFITYWGLMKLGNVNGLKSLVVDIQQKPAHWNGYTTIARGSLVIRNKTFISLAASGKGIIHACQKAKITVLTESLGIELPVMLDESAHIDESPVAVDDGMVTQPQLRLLHALADRLRVSPEDLERLSRLKKASASALIKVWQDEIRRTAGQ